MFLFFNGFAMVLIFDSRQHNNLNPVTQDPLAPGDLITLHYSRKPSGQYHDPISFKPFSEHSHIVAIATTGNVFLADSVKGGRDLVADVRFKKCVLCRVSLDSFVSTLAIQRGCYHPTESSWPPTCFCANLYDSESN